MKYQGLRFNFMAPPAGLEPATHGLTAQYLDSVISLENNGLQNFKNLNVTEKQNIAKNESLDNEVADINNLNDNLKSSSSNDAISVNKRVDNDSHKSLCNNCFPPSLNVPITTGNLGYTQNNISSKIADAIFAIDRLPIDDSVKATLITKLTGEL